MRIRPLTVLYIALVTLVVITSPVIGQATGPAENDPLAQLPGYQGTIASITFTADVAVSACPGILEPNQPIRRIAIVQAGDVYTVLLDKFSHIVNLTALASIADKRNEIWDYIPDEISSKLFCLPGSLYPEIYLAFNLDTGNKPPLMAKAAPSSLNSKTKIQRLIIAGSNEGRRYLVLFGPTSQIVRIIELKLPK